MRASHQEQPLPLSGGVRRIRPRLIFRGYRSDPVRQWFVRKLRADLLHDVGTNGFQLFQKARTVTVDRRAR